MKEKLRILVIEDSEDDYLLLQATLAASGMDAEMRRVVDASALDEALREQWDAITCDYNMPAFGPDAALSQLQERRLDIPFLVVSGQIPDEVAVHLMRHGAMDFVRKDNLSRLAPAVEREVREARLRQHARREGGLVGEHDLLTGLPGREQLHDHVQQAILDRHCGSSVGHDGLSLYIVDIARFRQITKTMGVRFGNRVLQEVGRRLRDSVSTKGFVASVGADKFALVNHGFCDDASGCQPCIQEAFHTPFVIDDETLNLGCHIAHVAYPGDGASCHELLAEAETRLYQDKDSRTLGQRHDNGDYVRDGRDLLRLESELYRALEHDEFSLHYQTQHDLRDGAVVGAEALLRWRHPVLGMVPPAVFVPILEEMGLIRQVGKWVLRRACSDILALRQRGLEPPRVAINISVPQFREPGFVDGIAAILDETGVKASALELEITEGLAMHHEEKTISTLQSLCDMGFSIAIDDFGTGYSSLAYLHRYPVTKLKIDKAFVQSEEPGSRAIVRAVIAMARELGMKLVAEGVETQAQADFLRTHGCEVAQGYFYARPAPMLTSREPALVPHI